MRTIPDQSIGTTPSGRARIGNIKVVIADVLSVDRLCHFNKVLPFDTETRMSPLGGNTFSTASVLLRYIFNQVTLAFVRLPIKPAVNG